MKQKLFVLGGNEQQIEEIRHRFGENFDVVICHSAMEIQRNLEHLSAGAVLPLASTNGHQPEMERLIDTIVAKGEAETSPKTLADRVDLLEQKIIESTLTRNRHHRKDTAAELGISRVTLYNKMKKFGMLN